MPAISRTLLILLLALPVPGVRADEARSRYFEQLRERGLFSLAESEAFSRLATPDLPLQTRCDFSIELSRTLMQHAGFAADDEREELWSRARATIQQLLDQDHGNPRIPLLNGQLAAVYVAEGDWLRGEREVRPFDEALRRQAQSALLEAIDRLSQVEGQLVDPRHEQRSRHPAAPTGYELRSLLHQVRYLLGLAYRDRAEFASEGSAERTRDLSAAEQSLRKLISAADEPLQTRAKLQLIACSRLKGALDRAGEQVAALDGGELPQNPVLQSEFAVEKARVLLARQKPADAAEFLLKERGKRLALSGEGWLLQLRSLVALMDIAREKQQQALAQQIEQQIETAVSRCEEQVGGFWARRCRMLWDNVQTAQKYGPELDGMMQQARADYTAGRIEAALSGYAAAETYAAQQQQPEMALELGFTHASILLDAARYEPAAAEFLRLATQYPGQQRTAKTHLLGAYCLGRLYDDKKTQARREAYTQVLDAHLQQFAADPTVHDARFLKAQMEEQRLQATIALPLYLEVDKSHPRALEAMAGAARCYDAILQRMAERRLSVVDLQQEATERLSAFLTQAGDDEQQWKAAHAETALRLAAILLSVSNEVQTSAASRSGGPQTSASEQALSWLTRVKTYCARNDANASPKEVVERLQQRSTPLLVVALARLGRFRDAQQQLETLGNSPQELLPIIERLSATTASPETARQVSELQLQLIGRLNAQRSQLPATDADRLDRAWVQSLIATKQMPRAIEVATRLTERSPKDAALQRDVAELFETTSSEPAQTLVKQCWRRVESSAKTGSTDWFTARLAILNASCRLQQWTEAGKLLRVTKVLYPELGGEPLKAQFEAVERDLAAHPQ